MNTKYFNDNFLDWETYYEGEYHLSDIKFNRAYDIWTHCKEMLDADNSSFIRTDVVSNLKRCLNQRLKNIESNYFFNSLPILKKHKRYLDKLECLNIVRPFMLEQLFEIRNDIEHNDAKPPGLKRTKKLLDITWYFLKSTDSLVRILKNSMIYTTDKRSSNSYWLQIDFDHSNCWEMNLRGWVPKDFVKNSSSKRFIEIEIQEYKSKYETKFPQYHADKFKTDYFVAGILKPNDDKMEIIIKNYLLL